MKLNELHDSLFEVLCIVDDICKKENVNYYLAFGTELGAVREQNFIPWDDDMDLQILYKDYKRFIKAMEDNLPAYMHVCEPGLFNDKFYDFTVRVYDDRKTIRKSTDEDDYFNNIYNHPGADVFILCSASTNKLKQKIMKLKTYIVYGMALRYRYALDYSKYTLLQRIVIKVLSSLGKNHSVKDLYEKLKKIMSQYDHNKTNILFNITSPVRSWKFLDSKIFNKIQYKPIRSRQFPVADGYDEELTLYYGDYMSPPKEMGYYFMHMDQEGIEEMKTNYEKRINGDCNNTVDN